MPTTTKKNTAPLTAAEKTACDRIRPLMNEGSVNDATAKYLIGTEVAAVMKDSEKYGEFSVGRIARALGCTQVLLYTYAKVANTWNSEEFTKLTEKKNAKGVSLSFTHYIAIEKLKMEDVLETKKARAALLEDVLKNSLTTRQTELKVAGPRVEKPATLSERVANVAKVVAHCEGVDATPEVLAKLETAAVEAAAAKKEFDAMMETVNQRIADVKRALATPVSSPDVDETEDADKKAAE